jgi:hypothetical protein
MACSSITTARGLGCVKSIGGIKGVYLASFDDVNSFAVDGDGKITGFTMASSKKFYQYLTVQETSSAGFAPTANVQNQSLYFNETLTLALHKYDATLRNQIIAMASNTLVAVVETQSGVFYYLGERSGLDINGGEGSTGTAAADRNGVSLTFQGINANPPREVAAAVVAGSDFIQA